MIIIVNEGMRAYCLPTCSANLYKKYASLKYIVLEKLQYSYGIDVFRRIV